MKIKIRVARWVARRIAKRTRSERRSLRDYQRQECRRISRAEKRTRGLRLYIAWSQPPDGAQVGRTAAVTWGRPARPAPAIIDSPMFAMTR